MFNSSRKAAALFVRFVDVRYAMMDLCLVEESSVSMMFAQAGGCVDGGFLTAPRPAATSRSGSWRLRKPMHKGPLLINWSARQEMGMTRLPISFSLVLFLVLGVVQ